MSDSFLADTQKRLRRLITWPEGVAEALRVEPSGRAPLTTVVRSDERLGAKERLDVYANAYFYRIHDVLAEDFETLFALLGEDDFHDLATSYLAVCPSEHPSLRHVGARLADFLASHDAAASLRERFPWAADLARLEAASEDVFDAADSPAARREDLAALPPEAWDGLRLQLRPSVRVLRLGWPVHEARRAVRAGEPAPGLAARPVRLCLWRADEQVVTRSLELAEARALESAREGIEFGALCVQAAAHVDESEAAAQAASWLTAWIDAALLLPPPG